MPIGLPQTSLCTNEQELTLRVVPLCRGCHFVRLDCMGVQLWLRQSYVLVTPVEAFTPVPLGPNEAVVGEHAVELTL